MQKNHAKMAESVVVLGKRYHARVLPGIKATDVNKKVCVRSLCYNF